MYTLIKLFFNMLGLIPRPVAIGMANAIGRIWFRVDGKHRRIALDNLTAALNGEKSAREISALARQTFKQLSRIPFEIGWGIRQDPKKSRQYFRVTGLDHMKTVLAKRSGALVLAAHIGNWELIPLVSAMYRVPLGIVYRPLDFEPLNQFFEKNRGHLGAELIPTKRSMRKILNFLKTGGCVAVLMDQNVDYYEGVYVDFFGKRACTNKGLALLARKTGAPVFPAFLVREPDGFRAVIGPEIPFIRTGDKTKDLENNTLAYNRVIEDFIRLYPDQWLWVHQRWKTKSYHSWPRLRNQR